MGYRVLLDSAYDVADIFGRTQDERYNEGEWIVITNVEQFSKIISFNFLEQDIMPELISFEFNLGFDILDQKINPRAETGIMALQWLVDFCINRKQKLPECIVHAENPQQASDLKTIIRNSKAIYNI